MDGTGKLFLDFMKTLPGDLRKEAQIYPSNLVLSYDDLTKLIRTACEGSPPFVLLAESFSTPVAIRVAAENPPNLKGLILCAGFATSPVRGITRWLASALAPVLMRAPLPDIAIRTLLLQRNAAKSLVADLEAVFRCVEPAVLVARLREVLRCDVRHDLGQIKVPLLYLHAKRDRLVGPRSLEEFRVIQAGARVVSLDGPHLLLQSSRVETARVVTNFLREIP